MTTFDERETAFENKFAHDAELKFKAEARRNKLVGLWAAGLLGKSGAEAAAYASEVVMVDFEEAMWCASWPPILAAMPTRRRSAPSWPNAWPRPSSS